MKSILLLFLLCPLILHAQISYEGKSGPGKGKHIVFVASDHEYRAEQTCPALARILAERQGFKTTVLFGVDKNGNIEAGASNIKGLEALKEADLMVIFTRFLDLPDDQMQHIVDYLDRGGPVVGLRTSSHAFKIPKGKKFSRFDFKYAGKEYEKGFGHQILGNTWVGHYGRNHKQGTRIQLIPEQKNHPILRGVGDGAFCYAGGYNGIAGDDFTVLANSQPMVSMKKDAALDAKKPPVPCTWTRHYTAKNGKQARVFHSTQGASEDILDPDYRRLVLNGIFWAVGLEDKIDAKANIDFVGPYKPTTFKMGGHVKNVKPADLQDLKSPIMPEPKAKPAKKKDAKYTKLDGPKAKKDPNLAQYHINQKSSPKPKAAAPIETKLPLEIAPKSHIALIGNLLLDNERRYGHLETLIHQHLPKHELEVRNFAWPADEIDIMPRPDNFGTLDQHLLYYKTDVIIAAFGYNESFAGKEGLESFKQRLDKFLKHLKSRAYNGKTAPQIVLLSPTPNEDTEQVNAAEMNNKNIALYTEAMKEVATSNKIAFIDSSYSGGKGVKLNRTSDGNSLTEYGHSIFAKNTFKSLFNLEAPSINEGLRALVIDKADQFFYRYRPLNTFYYVGGRSGSYGYLDFLPAMRNFDLMVENRFKAIHATAAGTPTQPDDSNLPKMDDVLLAIGANEFMSPEDELKAFKIDPRFEVNCFASEKDFPELACPISIRWDAKGRLWVSCSTAYPHIYPGQKPADKIIILEDTDQNGKADKCTTFADDLHIPLSFVLDGEGGVYCSEQPHLTYLKDTDGDDKADTREIIYTGFGCEDSHHSLHDFAWTPGGDLLFRESVFHHSQVETPYGPIRVRDSSWFLYDPKTRKLTDFGSYFNTNPWGVTFDKWGNHVASHPVFASTFHATNAPYPQLHPKPQGIQAYSGVCGHDFVDFSFWPEEMQGGFVKNRYKPTNNVEFHTWTEKEDHFAEEKKFDLIFSTNLSFIPVDLKFGPRGAMYICDWYNPVKGHAQYSLRDPRRDRKAGRIWRVVPKGATLADAPKIEDATVVELLNHLKSGQIRVRNWARRELRTRDKNEVLNALNTWTVRNSKDQHALLEALWVYQGIGKKKSDLVRILIHSDNHLIAAAAYGPLRFWAEEMPAEKVNALLKYGAEHSSQHVRREAVICASYIGTQEAFDAIQPVLAQPAGKHLAYAIQTALESKALRPYWTQDTPKQLKSLGKEEKKAEDTRTAEEKAFDKQKGLQTVKLGCVPERIQFDKSTLKVKAGAPVKFVFNNPDATQHNVVILDQGTPIQEIGMAANDMAKDANGAKKHYVPEDKRILHHSRLLDPHSSQTLRFIAPKKPGKYPFVCTFPGHWTVMKGELIVE
ncbi:hypothetical protein Rhal01_02481 [Rubritalea halochordaticola]|uniref:Uncharacterized protein n=1 Tax=Rubritalea halochordaticola TaxID=714537 RepID=A0ABP9V0V1_9BACT